MINPFEQLHNEISELKSMLQTLIEAQKIQPVTSEPKLKTQREVIKELGVTLPTIIDWRKRGLIKAKRIGSRIYYSQADIDAALIQKN